MNHGQIQTVNTEIAITDMQYLMEFETSTDTQAKLKKETLKVERLISV